MSQNPPVMQEMWVRSLGWEAPWRRKWQPAPVFLPGELHGQRSLVGYSPWGRKESDIAEQLNSNSMLYISLLARLSLCWSGPVLLLVQLCGETIALYKEGPFTLDRIGLN